MNKPDDAHWQKDEFDLIRQKAMEFAGMGLYRFRFDGEMLFADWGALRVFELDDQFSDPTAVAGKNLSDLIVYTGPKGRMRKELRERGRVRGWEWAFKTLKGNEKWVAEDAYLAEDCEGGGECIQVVVRDITARKRAEEALRISEERFRDTQTRGMRVSEQLRALMVAMNACRTLDEMLDPLLETAIEVCQMDGGGVYLVEGEEAILRRHRGLPESFVDEVACLSLTIPLVQQVLAMEGPGDALALAGEREGLYRSHGLRHVYSAPLRAGETVFGFLNVASMREEPPDDISKRSLAAMVLEGESLFTRLRAEEALRESERKYREILENIQEGYYELDS